MKRELLLGLTRTPTIGWKTIQKLLETGLEQDCLAFTAAEWTKEYPFLKDEQAILLNKYCTAEQIEEYVAEMKVKNIGYLIMDDLDYPALLKEIYEAPWLIYYIGNLSLLNSPGLGIVGSRKTTPYGRAVTNRLIPELVNQGWTIISGLALGIDAISHEATLKENGQTIAVLGSGIDIPYPSQHRSLYHRIAEKGLILSEYPPGTTPIPAFFPKRNRIISGLAYGIVVIEAAKESGSLITAQLALEQGREVFAVPGGIFDHQSVGTNLLIQQNGAKLITNTSDILEEFAHLPLIPKVGLDHIKGLNTGIMVEDIEKEILELIKYEKKHMNELLQETNLSFSELSHALLKLEMKRLIKALPGSYYQRNDLSP